MAGRSWRRSPSDFLSPPILVLNNLPSHVKKVSNNLFERFCDCDSYWLWWCLAHSALFAPVVGRVYVLLLQSWSATSSWTDAPGMRHASCAYSWAYWLPHPNIQAG